MLQMDFLPNFRIFFPGAGTWQTYIVKNQSVWHKVDKGVPLEYAATITVNPLTAFLMLEHCISLNSGTVPLQQLFIFVTVFCCC